MAVKCIRLTATPEQEERAQEHLRLLCTVSQKLTGYVIEVKGFHLEEGVELLLAMELADKSLEDYLNSRADDRLPQDEWVRARLPCDLGLQVTDSGCLGRFFCPNNPEKLTPKPESRL